MDTIRNGFQGIPPSDPVQAGFAAVPFDSRTFLLLLVRSYPRAITRRITIR